MANQKKEILATLFSDEVAGPFVTFLLNTHVAHQDVEKDAIVFKNFAKAAKSRFEKNFLMKIGQVSRKELMLS